MKYPLTVAFLLFCTFRIWAQVPAFQVQGHLLDTIHKKPIVQARILISGFMKDTISAKDGSFRLSGIPLGKHQLIISASGYIPKKIEIEGREEGTVVLDSIFLEKQAITLLEARLKNPQSDKNWQKHLKKFRELFVGTSVFAEQCTIENPWVLRFEADTKNEYFKAYANDVLVLNNTALGYQLMCFVEELEYAAKASRLKGAVAFREMNFSDSAQWKKWQQNRKEAYKGSLMHFLQSLSQGSLKENRFSAYRVNSTDNFYFATVPSNAVPLHSTFFKDTEYEHEKEFTLEEFLQVNYEGEPEHVYFRQFAYRIRKVLKRPSVFQPSWIEIVKPGARFHTGGWLCSPEQVDIYGYWEFEKAGDLLPRNYLPTN
jgi:hypothetical protein